MQISNLVLAGALLAGFASVSAQAQQFPGSTGAFHLPTPIHNPIVIGPVPLGPTAVGVDGSTTSVPVPVVQSPVATASISVPAQATAPYIPMSAPDNSAVGASLTSFPFAQPANGTPILGGLVMVMPDAPAVSSAGIGITYGPVAESPIVGNPKADSPIISIQTASIITISDKGVATTSN